MENKENVEIIDDDEILTLYDEDNKPVQFRQVACVEYQDEFYALVQPVKPMDGLGEDEAIIFKLEEQDDDTDLFLPVDDEELLEAVFNEYLRSVSDEEGCCCGHCHDDGCECDCDGEDECDCGECDCGHDHK